MLMLCVVGLLIAPSALHRIALHGESSGRIKMAAGRYGTAALLPFAVSLGIDVNIALERAFSNFAAGIGAGVAFGALAGVVWYGAGLVMKRHHGSTERRAAEAARDVHEAAPLHSRIEQMLTEGRVMLPGARALLGFQLAIVMTSAFDKLPASSRLVHGAALLCVAASVILLMTPPALHRIVWAGEDNASLLRIAGWLTAAALAPLAFGMAGDAYVVFRRTFGSLPVAIVLALVVTAGLLGLWFAWPLAERWARGRSGAALSRDAE